MTLDYAKLDHLKGMGEGKRLRLPSVHTYQRALDIDDID